MTADRIEIGHGSDAESRSLWRGDDRVSMPRVPSARRDVVRIAAAFVSVLLSLLWSVGDAWAVPAFARKYATSCQTCHTVYPTLNAFGEAFRRDGYRFPSQDNSLDSDAVKEAMLDLGQEEYADLFPEAVLPARIPQTVPLSIMVTGNVSYRVPHSSLYDAYGNSFSWNGIFNGATLYGAGSFTDKLTYYSRVGLSSTGISLDAGYLLWNDLVGPRHLLNLWVGRLKSPQLTSWGRHTSYISDTNLPAVSIAGLFNPNSTLILGQSPADGIELNGILAHRFAYAVGWLGSTVQSGLHGVEAEDFYAHIGTKLGGMSLDGEGPSGMGSVNAQKPWEETSLTVDIYGYHGVTLTDNGTGTTAVAQRSAVDAIGGAARGLVGSLVVDAGLQYQRHAMPYPGTLATTGLSSVVAGVPDHTSGNGYLAYGEIDYVVYPWLVPGVRTEYTFLDSDWGKGSLLRVRPGAAFLIRPNLKATLTVDVERAYKLPPAPSYLVTGWQSAGVATAPDSGQTVKVEVAQINAFLAWSF